MFPAQSIVHWLTTIQTFTDFFRGLFPQIPQRSLLEFLPLSPVGSGHTGYYHRVSGVLYGVPPLLIGWVNTISTLGHTYVLSRILYYIYCPNMFLGPNILSSVSHTQGYILLLFYNYCYVNLKYLRLNCINLHIRLHIPIINNFLIKQAIFV